MDMQPHWNHLLTLVRGARSAHVPHVYVPIETLQALVEEHFGQGTSQPLSGGGGQPEPPPGGGGDQQ